MTEVEKLASYRTRIVSAFAIAFAVWQGGDIVSQMATADSPLFFYAALTKIIGAVGFAASAGFFFLFYKRVQKAGAAIALKDEWNRFTSGLALQYGFFFLIGAIALMYGASTFWTLPTMPVLQGLLTIGVTGTLMAFVVLQNEGGAEN